jgi:hypothetical protein
MMRAGHDRPYLHCEECEWTWDDRGDLETKSGKLGIDYESSVPTLNSLIESGWKEEELTATDE